MAGEGLAGGDGRSCLGVEEGDEGDQSGEQGGFHGVRLPWDGEWEEKNFTKFCAEKLAMNAEI